MAPSLLDRDIRLLGVKPSIISVYDGVSIESDRKDLAFSDGSVHLHLHPNENCVAITVNGQTGYVHLPESVGQVLQQTLPPERKLLNAQGAILALGLPGMVSDALADMLGNEE